MKHVTTMFYGTRGTRKRERMEMVLNVAAGLAGMAACYAIICYIFTEVK